MFDNCIVIRRYYSYQLRKGYNENRNLYVYWANCLETHNSVGYFPLDFNFEEQGYTIIPYNKLMELIYE